MEPTELISAVLERVNIVDLVSEHTSMLENKQKFVGNCPFHDDNNASFWADGEIGYFGCYQCFASGDVLAFVQKTNNCDFMTALEYLAEKYRIGK